MPKNSNLAPALLLSLSLFGCSSSSPDTTTLTTAVGTQGSTYTIKDKSLDHFDSSIKKGMANIYSNHLCDLDLSIFDLTKHANLENIGNRGTAAGRGLPGGSLYIASDLDPSTKKVNIEHISTHEGLHACVEQKRVLQTPLPLPGADFTAGYVKGFYVSSSDAQNAPGIGSLDEAAVEWMANQVTPARSTGSAAYLVTTQLFGQIMTSRHVSLGDVSNLHEYSDIATMTQDMTGDTPTAKRIGCVIVQFAKVQATETSLADAQTAIKGC